jgi:hypothetical protein
MLRIEEQVCPRHLNQLERSACATKKDGSMKTRTPQPCVSASWWDGARAGQNEFDCVNYQACMRGARWRTQAHQEKKGGTRGFN